MMYIFEYRAETYLDKKTRIIQAYISSTLWQTGPKFLNQVNANTDLMFEYPWLVLDHQFTGDFLNVFS